MNGFSGQVGLRVLGFSAPMSLFVFTLFNMHFKVDDDDDDHLFLFFF